MSKSNHFVPSGGRGPCRRGASHGGFLLLGTGVPRGPRPHGKVTSVDGSLVHPRTAPVTYSTYCTCNTCTLQLHGTVPRSTHPLGRELVTPFPPRQPGQTHLVDIIIVCLPGHWAPIVYCTQQPDCRPPRLPDCQTCQTNCCVCACTSLPRHPTSSVLCGFDKM